MKKKILRPEDKYEVVWWKGSARVLPTKIIIDQKFYDVPKTRKKRKK